MRSDNSDSVTPDIPQRIRRRKINHRKIAKQIKKKNSQEQFEETSEMELQSQSQQSSDDQESQAEENTSNADFVSETVEKTQDPTDETTTVEPSVNSANSPGLPTPIHNQQQPDTYWNIAPLPIFKGESDECALTHLSRFGKVCRANNVSSPDMMVRIFPVTLEAKAALWYELNIDPNPNLTWEEIRTEFLKAYQVDQFVDPFRSELLMTRQGESESVNAFYMRMQWVLKKWPDLGFSDLVLKGIFIDGLRENFQDWVIARNPNSLEEARKFAQDWEQAENYRASHRRNPARKSSSGETGGNKCGFCEGPHEEARCEIRKKMTEMKVKSLKEKRGWGEGFRRLDGKWSGKTGSVVSSPAMSSVRREGGEWNGEGMGSRRRSACQCSKHGCWKKILRSNTFPNN